MIEPKSVPSMWVFMFSPFQRPFDRSFVFLIRGKMPTSPYWWAGDSTFPPGHPFALAALDLTYSIRPFSEKSTVKNISELPQTRRPARAVKIDNLIYNVERGYRASQSHYLLVSIACPRI